MVSLNCQQVCRLLQILLRRSTHGIGRISYGRLLFISNFINSHLIAGIVIGTLFGSPILNEKAL